MLKTIEKNSQILKNRTDVDNLDNTAEQEAVSKVVGCIKALPTWYRIINQSNYRTIETKVLSLLHNGNLMTALDLDFPKIDKFLANADNGYLHYVPNITLSFDLEHYFSNQYASSYNSMYHLTRFTLEQLSTLDFKLHKMNYQMINVHTMKPTNVNDVRDLIKRTINLLRQNDFQVD